MKSIFRTLAGIAMAFGLFACTEEKIEPAGQEGILGDAETYATLYVAMPSGTVGTKAGSTTPEGDITENGEGNENAFNNVSLYFFAKHATDLKADGPCLGILNLQGGEFVREEDPENKSVIYKSKVKNVGLEGSFYVYAVVNGSVPGVAMGTDISTFVKTVLSNTDAIQYTGSSLKALMMTSRRPAEVTLSSVAGQKGSSEGNPAIFTLSVERVAAKISYKANKAGNEYDIESDKVTGETNVKAKLVGYKLVHLRNDAYSFRKVGTDLDNALAKEHFGGVDLDAGNYVIDPYFSEKTEANSKPEKYPEFSAKAYLADATEYSTLPKVDADNSYGFMTYCMENTMTAAEQLKGFSTGVIFKAVYTPNKVSKMNDTEKEWEAVDYVGLAPEGEKAFYLYDSHIYYSTVGEITAYYGLTDGSMVQELEYNTEERALECYYKYWIQHLNNSEDGNMGIMEYAIVRNNAYKLDVTGISGLGEPTEEIDPEDPDEDQKLYLQVNVQILPWVVRENSIIL